MKGRRGPPPDLDRNRRILEQRGLGYSFRQIAKMHNISAERARQIVAKEDRRRKHERFR